MNKYKLTPIDLSDPCWAQYREEDKQPIEVEAEDEAHARLIALGKVGTMVEGSSNGPISPWDDPEKTTCELLIDAI